jgi:hypothetical protein
MFTDIGSSIKCLGFFNSSLISGVNSDKKCGVAVPSKLVNSLPVDKAKLPRRLVSDLRTLKA